MFPPTIVLPHPPNNILMSYTVQARLAGIRFSIKLKHKMKKKKNVNASQDLWVMLCRADWHVLDVGGKEDQTLC